MSAATILTLPAPAERVSLALYSDLRSWMLEHDQDAPEMLAWSRDDLRPPSDADGMAWEIVWIILCAGRSAQAARTIERKVRAAILDGRPVVDAFGYRAKALAIEQAWNEREKLFSSLGEVLALNDPVRLVDWCGALSFVGDDTKFQLAKNFGADVCKPDIWLCRLTGFPDKPRRPIKVRFPACMALCRQLADASGDSIATIDSILWLACNKGVLVVDENAGPIAFAPKVIKTRSIFEAAPSASGLPLFEGSKQ